jgi:hypothetical protein
LSDAGGRFEAFDANKRFAVVRDDEGYGVWRLDDFDDGEPLERFSEDDAGYEAAVSRWKEISRADRRSRLSLMSWLKVAVIASAAITAVSSLIFTIAQVLGDPFAGAPADIQYRLALVSQSALNVTVVLAAVYVVVWLDSRRRSD